jgi:hypothetical protein
LDRDIQADSDRDNWGRDSLSWLPPG